MVANNVCFQAVATVTSMADMRREADLQRDTKRGGIGSFREGTAPRANACFGAGSGSVSPRCGLAPPNITKVSFAGNAVVMS